MIFIDLDSCQQLFPLLNLICVKEGCLLNLSRAAWARMCTDSVAPTCLKPELRLGSPLQILARPVTTPGIISHCSAARTINIWIAGRERNHKRTSVMKWDSRWLKLAQSYWSECLVCRSGLCFLLSTWPMLYDPAPNHKGKAGGGIVAQPSLYCLECLSLLLSKSEKTCLSSCLQFMRDL